MTLLEARPRRVLEVGLGTPTRASVSIVGCNTPQSSENGFPKNNYFIHA
jgi:hypothetical protein